ncbi:MAG: hypothetical protein JXR29_04650 [Methylothermaceae bacterium]|nr:hypothetical protein [Methylothermaceae bacterium]
MVVSLVNLLFISWALVGCNILPNSRSQSVSAAVESPPRSNAVVDCLLPSRIKKLSGHIAFIAPRRTVKLQAAECEGRGGEFVAQR